MSPVGDRASLFLLLMNNNSGKDVVSSVLSTCQTSSEIGVWQHKSTYFCPGSGLGETGTWNNYLCQALTLHAVLQVLGLVLLHDNYLTTPLDS